MTSAIMWATAGGPEDARGHAAAARALDPLLAGFIQDYRRIRRRSPIVAIVGDHGEEFGEHGGITHGATVHAEQVRVGMLLLAPGLDNIVHDGPVSASSLPATIIELLGLAAPKTMVEPSLRLVAHTPGGPSSDPAAGRTLARHPLRLQSSILTGK